MYWENSLILLIRKVKVAQSCLTLVSPWTIQSMEFCRPEYQSGQRFLPPGNLPNPGIKPRSPTLQVNSLPAGQKGLSISSSHYLKMYILQVLGCCVFIFISFYAYFNFFFDFFCDLLVIQKCVVQPPYVGIFNSFSPVIEI